MIRKDEEQPESQSQLDDLPFNSQTVEELTAEQADEVKGGSFNFTTQYQPATTDQTLLQQTTIQPVKTTIVGTS